MSGAGRYASKEKIWKARELQKSRIGFGLAAEDFWQQKIGGERKCLRLSAFQTRLEHFLVALLENSWWQNLERRKFVADRCAWKKRLRSKRPVLRTL